MFLFPPRDTAILAEFLCALSDTSNRPASLLKCATSAISALYDALGMDSPSRTTEIQRLISALVKSGTTMGMNRSSVMPIQPFTELFLAWPDNQTLSLKDLRAKCITLLALTLMLRPSDIAPKSVQYDCDNNISMRLVFQESQVTFCDDGVKIVFLGIKNDTSRSGFEVFLPRGSVPQLDPVSALQVYMDRTRTMRATANGAVFLTLTKPYLGVSARVVSQILSSMIVLVGLAGRGFTAKSFRPTGASVAVAHGFDPDKVRRLGRWKTPSVFLEHYVHNKIDNSYVDALLR